VVWETNPVRAEGAMGYDVIDPATTSAATTRHLRRQRRRLVARFADRAPRPRRRDRAGRLLRGAAVSFDFPPAFMRELRLRVAAEFKEPDLPRCKALLAEAGRLSFDGLITHRSRPPTPPTAYETAFNDPTCLKMILDWRGANG
jgi:3-hydroxyethyl bacteriochlorophyllide a dehydrogenase